MKFTLCTLLGLIALASFHAAPLWDCVNIRQQKPGELSIRAAGGSVILDEDFSAPNTLWHKPENYGGFLRFQYRPFNGRQALCIERDPERALKEGEKYDSAWGMRTQELALPPDASSFALVLKVQSNDPRIRKCWSSVESYNNEIIWIDKDGKWLPKRSEFRFNFMPHFPAETLIEGDIPDGAAKAMLNLGIDFPDMQAGQFLAFSKAQLRILPKSPECERMAFFTTEGILPQKDRVLFSGRDITDGAVSFQIATTTDIYGAISNWTPFHGADGTQEAWFENGALLPVFSEEVKAIRLRVRMKGNGSSSPMIRLMQVGDYSDNSLNPEPNPSHPHAVRISPSPVQNPLQAFQMKVKCTDCFIPKVLNLKINDEALPGSFFTNLDVVTVLPKGGFRQGVNIITVTMEDSHGFTATEDLVHYVGDLRQGERVATRDDGMMLIDGKPFFPIGMACVDKDKLNGWSYDRVFKMFQDCGMNIARNYSGHNFKHSDYVEFVSAAQKHGIRLYLSANMRGPSDKDIRRLAQSLVMQMSQPHLAWDIGDDTSFYFTPDEFEAIYQTCMAIDPTRPTIAEDSIGALEKPTFEPYAPFSQIFAPEIYPLHSKHPNRDERAVPSVISTMNEIKRCFNVKQCTPRSIWPLVQYFTNCDDHDRLPTAAELRAMTYAAIIHGANGIIWYRYGGYRQNQANGFKPEEWNVVANMARELRSLYDILCDRVSSWQPAIKIVDGPAVDALGNTSVSTLLKGTGTTKTLFAVCSIREKTTVRITVPEGTRSVTDAFTKKNVAVVNGAVAVDFDPLGVAILMINQ